MSDDVVPSVTDAAAAYAECLRRVDAADDIWEAAVNAATNAEKLAQEARKEAGIAQQRLLAAAQGRSLSEKARDDLEKWHRGVFYPKVIA